MELGILYGKIGDLDKAEEQFHQILKQDKENYLAYHNLGYVYQLREIIEQAIAEYEKSLEINPDQEDLKILIKKLKSEINQ